MTESIIPSHMYLFTNPMNLLLFICMHLITKPHLSSFSKLSGCLQFPCTKICITIYKKASTNYCYCILGVVLETAYSHNLTATILTYSVTCLFLVNQN